jgi:hypothetical protein
LAWARAAGSAEPSSQPHTGAAAAAAAAAAPAAARAALARPGQAGQPAPGPLGPLGRSPSELARATSGAHHVVGWSAMQPSRILSEPQ